MSPFHVDYNSLVQALLGNLTQAAQAKACQHDLHHSMQYPSESPQEFADRLDDLAVLAFPDKSADGRGEQILEQFLDGIYDDKVVEHVNVGVPYKFLNDAVAEAAHWTAYERDYQG